MSFKVISLNVLGWFPCSAEMYWEDKERRKEIIADCIHNLCPDSFGLQECNMPWLHRIAPMLEREYLWVGERNEDSQRNFNPVFYRKDTWSLLDTKTLWLSDTPEVWGSNFSKVDQSRMVTYATLKNKTTGQIYTHYNTHLGIDRSVLQKQLEVLRTITDRSKYPFILTGDFNVRKEWAEYRYLEAQWKDARFSAPVTCDEDALDFCLTSTDIQSEEFSIITDPYVLKQDWEKGITKNQKYFISDHYPISLQFSINKESEEFIV